MNENHDRFWFKNVNFCLWIYWMNFIMNNKFKQTKHTKNKIIVVFSKYQVSRLFFISTMMLKHDNFLIFSDFFSALFSSYSQSCFMLRKKIDSNSLELLKHSHVRFCDRFVHRLSVWRIAKNHCFSAFFSIKTISNVEIQFSYSNWIFCFVSMITKKWKQIFFLFYTSSLIKNQTKIMSEFRNHINFEYFLSIVQDFWLHCQAFENRILKSLRMNSLNVEQWK